jgi:hypothetical protein
LELGIAKNLISIVVHSYSVAHRASGLGRFVQVTILVLRLSSPVDLVRRVYKVLIFGRGRVRRFSLDSADSLEQILSWQTMLVWFGPL